MELRHLRYFIAVAEEENVTRAAAKLHVSQPTLSRQIVDLEAELGFLLLARSAKAVRLTDAGRVFLTGARAALQQVHQAVKAARTKAEGLQGEIHVGFSPSLTVDILPKALRTFGVKFPGLRVILHDFSSDEIVSHLREGKLDVALTIRPTGKLLRGLRFVELAHYGLCIAASPAHRVGGLQTVTLEELASERLIGFSRKDYPEYHDIMEAIFKSTGRRPEIHEQDSIASLVAEVEAGRGVAIVSDCSKSVLTPKTKVLPLTAPSPPIIVGALLRKGTVRLAVDQFIAAAKPAQDEPGSGASPPLC